MKKQHTTIAGGAPALHGSLSGQKPSTAQQRACVSTIRPLSSAEIGQVSGAGKHFVSMVWTGL